VGTAELEKVASSGWCAFPPRLPDQPIFYPVCNEAYAREIANRWNTRGGARGFVLRFEVSASFLSRHQRHTVGSRVHEEYWIPAEELSAFNAAIVGSIELVASY
jgi:hypothetical protein